MVQNILKSWWRLALLASLLALGACGSESKPGAAPMNFAVQAGENQVVITWDEDPTMTYWIFSAAAPAITTENYAQFPEARVMWPVHSPFTLPGLTNGKTYSFIMNATKNGSGAGPATSSLSAVPRLAGGVWTAGGAAGTADLNRMAYSGYFMAVGNGGSIQRSTDGKTWTALTSGTTADLTALFFDNVKFMALGNDGKLLTSTDANSWTVNTVPTNTTQRMNGLVGGANVYLAVGNAGTIITSPPDLSAWTARASGTTRNLNRVQYTNLGFIAVGDGGTIITSLDGVTWTAQNSGTTADLLGVYFNGTAYVVVGKGGTVLSSTSGFTGTRTQPNNTADTSVYGLMNWETNASGTTQDLKAVTAGSQFVVVGNAGTVLTGLAVAPGRDANSVVIAPGNTGFVSSKITWTVGNNGMTAAPSDILTASGAYVVVGAGGSNVKSF